jgi:B-cell receptor-associated protein 31
MEAMKAQAEGLSKEYDRLSEEYNKLEVKLRIGGGDKKDS